MSAAERYLVVGSGSIARRHLANLKRMFPQAEVGCVSASGRRLTLEDTPADVVYDGFDAAIASRPRFAIVASPASMHVDHASRLLQADISVLIEKPLSSSMAVFRAASAQLEAHRRRIEVAYTLRHLPSARRFKQCLEEGLIGRLHAVLIEVGQYLPDWRPGTDYRKNVSARKALGGGVLLELSHELDYLVWLFGRFETAYCVAGRSGTLQIDVEDRANALLHRKDGLVASLHMDFLQRVTTRTCKVIGERGNLLWNLATNSVLLQHPGGRAETIFSEPQCDRNDMYLAQLARFARVAAGELAPLVGLEEAVYVLQLIEALRCSSERGQVVSIEEALA